MTARGSRPGSPSSQNILLDEHKSSSYFGLWTLDIGLWTSVIHNFVTNKQLTEPAKLVNFSPFPYNV
jgi:hypothetical protein